MPLISWLALGYASARGRGRRQRNLIGPAGITAPVALPGHALGIEPMTGTTALLTTPVSIAGQPLQSVSETAEALEPEVRQSVISTDLTGRIVSWNAGASIMLGGAHLALSARGHIADFHLIHELESRSEALHYPSGATVLSPGFSALVEIARISGAEVRDWTYRRHDGTPIPVSVAVTQRLDQHANLCGYTFVATDMTDSIEAARSKDDFVGLISHELRTPLSSILGYLDLLRDDENAPLTANQTKYLEVAERNAHRVLALVEDLLFTTQVSSGVLPFEIGRVCLAEVVGAAVLSALPSAATAGIELGFGGALAEVFVPGDSVRLGQACDNLISNALKYTPRGGTVTIELQQTDDSAVITVRDTGIGIPAIEIEGLYSRFFRASTAIRNEIPGIGLGLTITKSIVDAHRGGLRVVSEEGVGSSFTITLPRTLEAVNVDAR